MLQGRLDALSPPRSLKPQRMVTLGSRDGQVGPDLTRTTNERTTRMTYHLSI